MIKCEACESQRVYKFNNTGAQLLDSIYHNMALFHSQTRRQYDKLFSLILGVQIQKFDSGLNTTRFVCPLLCQSSTRHCADVTSSWTPESTYSYIIHIRTPVGLLRPGMISNLWRYRGK